MPTQAQQRTIAKHRVRVMRGAVKLVDTRIEIMERRLDKLLERKTLITVPAFDSYLVNMRGLFERIKILEQTTMHAMTTFLIE